VIVRLRLLVDENLSVRRPTLAHQRGYAATHVRDLGLLSEKDWALLDRIAKEDWTLVTNNVAEFRDRYRRKLDLHAGVVFLTGVVGIVEQSSAMRAALDDIDRNSDLTNTEVLVESHVDGFRVRRFDLP
jgi:predicted nuclease of predicted toxin-antitoxin system